MGTSYIMEAVDNYNTANAALLAAGDEPANFFTDQYEVGRAFDPVRREIIFNAVICGEDTITNDSGFTLWNGSTSVAPDASFDPTTGWNLWICTVNIDTKLTTFFSAYDADNMVPAGIDGSDGTWRRFTDTSAGFVAEGPRLVDPYTGDLWMHAFGTDLSCTVYWFGRANNFSQTLSPLNPTDAGHMQLLGMTEDWVYILNNSTDFQLLLVPRVVTAAEVTADELLAYATYDFDASSDYSVARWRPAVTQDGSLYIFQCQLSGTRGYKLWKFTPPSAFIYPATPGDGGFTDVTPWSMGAGPDTGTSAYTVSPGSGTNVTPDVWNENIILTLPATSGLVCLSKLFPQCTGAVTDPNLFKVNCTYVDPGGGTFDYHAAFITGYMTGAWTTTSDPALAAWSVQDFIEVNPMVDSCDYDYSDDGFEYVRRKFFVVVQPVVAGAWTPDASTNHILIVTYDFISGSAPALVSVVDENGWDVAYTAYAADVGRSDVVFRSITGIGGLGRDDVIANNILYDAQTNAYWEAGENGWTWFLNPALAYRDDVDNLITSPFLRLSFAERSVTSHSAILPRRAS